MTDPENTTEPFGKDESVVQCLDIMREVSQEQKARARHLDLKAGTLAGFCATILTLNVALNASLLGHSASTTPPLSFRVLFFVAALALATAAIVAVVGVLKPMDHDDLTDEQIDAYSDRPKVITPASDLRMTWLRTVTDMTRSDRRAGDAKSTRTNIAVGFLALGLVCVAGQAAILSFHHERGSAEGHSARAGSATASCTGSHCTAIEIR